MAYTAQQKKSHIMELQKYLYGISFFNNNIPRVIPDGYYGKETTLAVKAFQREYNLPDTGSTDYATWNKIVEIYRNYVNSKPEPLDIFPSMRYTLRQGDAGFIVYVLQSMLLALSEEYINLPKIEVNGQFDAPTADAVRKFQNKTNLRPDGNVNVRTWNMLVKSTENTTKD